MNLPYSASLVKICFGDLSLSDASASRRQQCHVSYLFGRTEISREQTLFCSLANPSFLSSHRHHHQLFRAPNFNSQTVVCCNFFQIPCLCLWPVLNPPPPQTLLFSATQTKSVKDLARLSLKNPTYVSVHEHSTISTPKNLVQNYVVCETHDKISFLWSFIRNHLNQKIIVFFQSCKQVKFILQSLSLNHESLLYLKKNVN